MLRSKLLRSRSRAGDSHFARYITNTEALYYSLILLQLALAGMGIGIATVVSGPFFCFFLWGRSLTFFFLLARARGHGHRVRYSRLRSF